MSERSCLSGLSLINCFSLNLCLVQDQAYESESRVVQRMSARPIIVGGAKEFFLLMQYEGLYGVAKENVINK